MNRKIRLRWSRFCVFCWSDYRILINLFLLLQKNATLGGAISGLLISAASNNGRDKVIKDAITAGAVATAAEFINYFT